MRILALFMASAFLLGCSSTPLSPKGEAVYYALETDTLLRTWEESCKEVNLDVKQKALLTRQNWWQRNGTFVEAADFGLAYDMIQISGDRPETGARLALAVTWDIVENADQTVEKQLAKGDAAATCAEVMESFSKGDYDLNRNKVHYNQLVELQGLKQAKSSDLKLKQASVEKISQKEFGRSYYVVEKIAAKQGCDSAKVQLIKNNWPSELYGLTCPNNTHNYVQCEWGRCRLIE